MTRRLLTLILALLVSTIIAAPTNSIKKRSFKIHRVENKNYVPNGKMAMKRAYMKFGLGDIEPKPTGEVAASVKAAANATAAGSEDGATPAVGNQNDAQFLSPITVGGQKMVVNFDSGSSDLWVFNTNLPAASQQGHTIYDPKKSTTAQASQNRFNISYGDGSNCAGPTGFDTVDIGGSTVSKQAIGLPNDVSPSFVQDTASNGLVGLAFSQLNTIKPTKQKTFFDNVQGDLSEPVFTAQLKGGTVGAYEFGTIDKNAFTGQLTTVPVDSSRGFWEFQSNTAKVGNKTFTLSGKPAIADTGTSLMLVGSDLLDAYWSQVEGASANAEAGGVIFPCDTKLPSLQIAVGDTYMAEVPGVDLNFATVGQDATTGQTMCFGGLQSNGDNPNDPTAPVVPFSIYGDVWFKSQFVAFQANGPSLGIAPHA